PVIRESGGDRSPVTGGTRVTSDRILVEITQEPGKSFLDRMIALVEGASRRKTPNEIALNILLAGLTLIFMIVVATTIMKISVNPASRMLSAISFGVLRREAPSTSAIMRSMKDWPGSWVISTM